MRLNDDKSSHAATTSPRGNVRPIAPHLRALGAPEPLRALPGWLVWRYETNERETKPRKIPYYVNGTRRFGEQGAPKDRSHLVAFAAARDAAVRGNYDGVGLAMLPDWGVTALDVDHCVDADGNLPPEIEEIVQKTYAEYSPSGTGIRAFFTGALGNHKSHADATRYGLETFSTNGFITFTGNILPHVDLLGYEDRIAALPPQLVDLCERRFGSLATQPFDPDDFMAGREPRLGLTVERMQELLDALDPDMGRDPWVRVGLALHHETEGDDTGFDLWDEWSSEGGTYPGTERLRYEWDSFGRTSGRRQVTMASVIKMANERRHVEAEEEEWLPPTPLPSGLSPVQALTEDMLPAELRPWLVDIAERMVVPLDYAGIPAMVMLGSLVGRKVCVRPEAFTDWSEPGNLWGAIVAPPGAMKTPVVAQVFAPIKQLEAEVQVKNRAALEQHQVALLVHKIAKDTAIKSAKKATSADLQAELARYAVDPPAPPEKRYMTTDATVEKLGVICADNPNGILIHRDELPTLLLDLQREEKALLRGFLLTGWTEPPRDCRRP